MTHNLTEITACSDSRDWARLKEIRESIVTRAPIFANSSLASPSQPQPPIPSQPQQPAQPQARAQPLPQSSYYQAVRPQTPPNYAMGSYGQSGYADLNGLRSQNPPPVPFQPAPSGPSARLRPNAGLVPPSITYKTSPFYELKYQLGDVRTLEGTSSMNSFFLRFADE